MTEEAKKSYVARVAKANRSELVVLIYEMMDTCLQEAKEASMDKGSMEAFRKSLTQFRGFLNELLGSLDYKYPISGELFTIYTWVDKEAAKALASGDGEILEKLQQVLETLKKGFDEVAKQDDSAPVMEHTETIYAGLTYGKDSLNETVGLGDEKRGYRV